MRRNAVDGLRVSVVTKRAALADVRERILAWLGRNLHLRQVSGKHGLVVFVVDESKKIVEELGL